MSVANDPKSPMYIPDENRKIARERAAERKSRIKGYLDVRDSIPTGTNRREMTEKSKARILEVLGGTADDWNDHLWHISNVIKDTGTLSRILDLNDEETGEIEKAAALCRWAVSPYYASLIDPSDRSCPIYSQSIPTSEEYIAGGTEDHYAIKYNSPAPLITRLYPDRLIINVTNICAMFCRHCLRKKDISSKDMIYPKDDVRAALDYVAESPEIRDVLLTGGDALALSDDYLDWILGELDDIDHVEIKRLGSRMLATLPQRVTPELCSMLARHKPVYLNTQFNSPMEITPEAEDAVDRLIGAGVVIGNQSVLLRGINNDVNVMKKLVHELVRIRVRPYYIFNCKKLEGIRHFRVPVADGLNIIENLRGYTSGLAVPTFIITAPEGRGKTPMSPTYLLNYNRNGKLLFRTWAGDVCEYEDELLDE